jgi:hypothetical protein
MLNISIDILTQLPRLFKEVKTLVYEPAQNKAEKRNNFFVNEIEPIHNTIEEIYKDYTNSFVEILELINNREYNKELQANIREEIKKRRLREVKERIKVYNLSLEFQDIRDKPYYKKIKIRSSLQKNEIELFGNYSGAIKRFLACFSEKMNVYDHYVGFYLFKDERVQENIRRYETSMNYHSMTGYSHLLKIIDDYIFDKELSKEANVILNDIIRAYCNAICQRVLPEVYGDYIINYTRLRLNMCYG